MCTLITSKGTDIDENIANQNHATRTRTPKPGYLKLTNIGLQVRLKALTIIDGWEGRKMWF
jgi:hypothetical protein